MWGHPSPQAAFLSLPFISGTGPALRAAVRAAPGTHPGHTRLGGLFLLLEHPQARPPYCPAALPCGGFLSFVARLMCSLLQEAPAAAWMDSPALLHPGPSSGSAGLPDPSSWRAETVQFTCVPFHECLTCAEAAGISHWGPLGAPPGCRPLPTAEPPHLHYLLASLDYLASSCSTENSYP